MATSLNGWPVLAPGSSYLHTWVLDLRGPQPGELRITCRQGSVGFLLMHQALWWNDVLEPLLKTKGDDGSYAYRLGRGLSDWSNHASATAMDLNWSLHPHLVPVARHFTPKQIKQIHNRLPLYKGVLDWGGDWSARWVDGMHTEVAPGTTMTQCENVARTLMDSPRGKRLLEANPGQREVILS